MNLKLTPEETDFLIKQHAPESCKEGFSTFELCGICGHVRWIVTQTKEPRGAAAVIVGNGNCPRCAEVNRRDPELSSWVLDVVAWQWKLRKTYGQCS